VLVKQKKEDKRRGHEFVDHYRSSLSYGRKKGIRIHYLDSVDELRGGLAEEIERRIIESSSRSQQRSEREELIDRQVRAAVEKLLPTEKQFVELFYFQVRSYQEIAGIMKKKTHKLQRLHQRALSKLRILLADFVEEQFKLKLRKETNCVICKSPFRKELDELIRGKEEEETYSRLIRVFRRKYGINVRTPQTIIGHRKKHMV
jgi:RNA polymerase sigma factor (sigma-70 family)